MEKKWKERKPMLHFFSEGEARSIGELNYPEMKLKKTDNLEMKIVSEYTSRPSEYLQMRMVLHQVVKAAVGIARSQKCYACNMDPPSQSQKDHMQSGGCMDENSFDAEEYVDVVMSIIKSEGFNCSVQHHLQIPGNISRTIYSYGAGNLGLVPKKGNC